jgi:hypothetical protein
MKRHAHVGVFRGDPRNQLRQIGFPGTIVCRPDLPLPSASSLKIKETPFFLPDATVTGDAILIEDWPDIAD